jgi:hypothetical protein
MLCCPSMKDVGAVRRQPVLSVVQPEACRQRGQAVERQARHQILSQDGHEDWAAASVICRCCGNIFGLNVGDLPGLMQTGAYLVT